MEMYNNNILNKKDSNKLLVFFLNNKVKISHNIKKNL